MKMIEIKKSEIRTKKTVLKKAANGAKYFALTHGEEGRGRWQVVLPLFAREFPPPETQDEIEMTDDYRLIKLKNKDPKGNDRFLIGAGQPDDTFLVFLHLSPGYRGGASFEVEGNAAVIAKGEEAQGSAGRMGGAECPIIHVTGPCSITWERYGRLYGEDSKFEAFYDGEEWVVGPQHDVEVEKLKTKYLRKIYLNHDVDNKS